MTSASQRQLVERYMRLLVVVQEVQDTNPSTELGDRRQSFSAQKPRETIAIRHTQLLGEGICTAYQSYLVRDGS